MTNFGDDTYVWDIRNARKEAGIQIKNLLQTRRIKNAKLVNPAVLMGLLTTPRARAERMAELWGTDPVHASNQGYTNLAKSVMEEVKSETVVHTRKPSSVSTTTTTLEAIGLTEAMATPREGAEATGADRNRTICNIQM